MPALKSSFSLRDSLKICLRHSPVEFGAIAVLSLLAALAPTAQVLVFALFIDRAIAVAADGAPVLSAALPLLLVLAIIGYQQLSRRATDYCWLRLSLNLQKLYEPTVVDRCAALDYRHIEDPDTRDLIFRMSQNGSERIQTGYRLIVDAVKLIARIAGVLVIIFTQSWPIALIILCFGIPLVYLATKAGRRSYDAHVEVTAHRRRYEYLMDILTNREAADERGLFAYSRAVKAEYDDQYNRFRAIDSRAIRKNNATLELGSIITCALVVLIIAFLLDPLMRGVMSAGLFLALVAAAFELIEIMSWDFTGLVDGLVQDRHFRREYAAFLSLSEQSGALDTPSAPIPFESLEFKDVRFRYPGTDKIVLDGLSFALKKDTRYAIVGVNGAGKTTIIKLLSGLYREYEGEILLNGRELRAIPPAELKASLSIIFQDFARYQITARENIAIGAINGFSGAAFDEAVRSAGLDEMIEKLPDGLDTVLGRLAGRGYDLSGGEWQKLAIARGILNPGGLCILDEPTAALDPLTENRVYEDFGRISAGRTTLMISHRLGSTKLADEILVLADGRVAEAGSHDRLMARDGLYREIYDSQRRWYL